MIERPTRRPVPVQPQAGNGRTALDVQPAQFAMWTNASIGGNGTQVHTDPGQPMVIPVRGDWRGQLLKWSAWYKGPWSTYPPSHADYTWSEGLAAVLDGDSNAAALPVAVSIPGNATFELKRMIYRTVDYPEWCAWADAQLLSQGIPSDLRTPPGTLASRLANCPRLLAALQAKTPIRMCLMGDSYQALTTAYPRPFLLRSYPGMIVEISNASLGSHGAEQWVAEGQTGITNALQPLAPDVVCFGGISSTWVDDSAWLTLVDMIRVALPDCEIILSSDSRGTRNESTSSAIVAATATAKSTAFFDASATLDNWAADSGFDVGGWFMDGVHFDMRGGLFLGRGWAWFLGAHV